MDQVNALLAHYQQEPPADCLIAAFLGYKPPARESDLLSEEESARRAAAILASAYAAHERALTAPRSDLPGGPTRVGI